MDSFEWKHHLRTGRKFEYLKKQLGKIREIFMFKIAVGSDYLQRYRRYWYTIFQKS